MSHTTTSYHVEVFSVEDVQLYGPFGLKLVPLNDTHRCWYFIAEDEENKKEWEEVLLIYNIYIILYIYSIGNN
jgi:hypothetical protein